MGTACAGYWVPRAVLVQRVHLKTYICYVNVVNMVPGYYPSHFLGFLGTLQQRTVLYIESTTTHGRGDGFVKPYSIHKVLQNHCVRIYGGWKLPSMERLSWTICERT
jgi:hypothetical protein